MCTGMAEGIFSHHPRQASFQSAPRPPAPARRRWRNRQGRAKLDR